MDGHGIFYSIIIGFFAGLIARALYPGDQKAGFIMTTLLGIAGSWVANCAGKAMGFYQGEVAGLIGSVVGAFIVLSVYLFIHKKTNN